MKTLLVLTDFSEAATSAAFYACMLARQLNIHTIVLYHSHQGPIPVSEIALAPVDEETIQCNSLQRLADLELQLKAHIPKETIIRCRADETSLNDINSIAKDEEAELVVMGTVGKTKLEEIFLGSNVITVCHASRYPVIVVPARVKIQPVKKIIFACDMKDIKKTVPVVNLKKVINSFNVPLTVLNVDFEDTHFTAETPLNTMVLHDLLKEHNPEYYNMDSDDVGKGILEFAKLNPASMIMFISKKHNFMEGVFYKSITRQLAYTSPLPLLIFRATTE